MVKMIFSGKVLGILVCTPFLFVLSELSPQKSSPGGNFRLAGLLRLPLIGAILAQRTALHNTPSGIFSHFAQIPSRTARNFWSASLTPAECSPEQSPRQRTRRAKVWQFWRREFPQAIRKVRQSAQEPVSQLYFMQIFQLFSRFQ